MNSQERFTQICTFLDQRNFSYHPDPDQQRLGLMVEDEMVIIAVEEDGEFIKIILPQLLTVPADHPHYEAALETLAHFGWEYKLVRWQRDPEDGEVRVQADLPIEDSELTAPQFWRTLQGTVQIAKRGQERLQAVLATGEDSGNSSSGEMNSDTWAFFKALSLAEMEGGEAEVYKELDKRGGQVDPQLPQAAKIYLEQFSTSKPETRDGAVGLIGNLAINLKNYPRGHREINVTVAIALYHLVLEARPRETVPDKWADTQNNLGNAYSDLPTGDRAANLQQAIACYEAALTVWKPDTAPLQWATTQNNLGSAYKNLPTGDRAANLKQAIACYQAALTVWKPDTAPLQWAMTQNNLGNAYSDLPTGDRAANLKEAIACYEAALTVWKPELFPLECLTTARNWAKLEFNEGHWQQALTQYQVAIEAIEQSRRGALSEERRQQIVKESIYIYENAIQAAINLKDIPTALEIVERVRAKRLVDLLATADLYQNGDIPDTVRQYLQKLDDLDNQIAQKRGELSDDSRETKPDGTKTRQLRAATAVTADIAQLEQQKQGILDELSNLDEVVAKLRQVKPPKLADFIPLLQPRTAILSFYTTDDDTHIFILRHGETVPTCFTCKGQGYKTLQQWLRENWVIPYVGNKAEWIAQMPATLAELARRLELDRLIAEKLQGLDELILIPHLFLHQIPFAALPVSGRKHCAPTSLPSHTPPPSHTPHTPPSYFGDKFILRYAPSVQVLGFCDSRDPVTAQKYGTAENATNDLPCSGFEGANVARLFDIKPEQRLIGSDATRKAYRQLLEKTSHLVSTHHAQSRFDNPLESGLRLSDGPITVSQLLSPGWRFKELDEVFLSCCETGLFFPNSAIDEPVAVSTGFLCAGARGVIASQWSIYDLSAALLSILYHEQRKAGKNRPVALQAAQKEMREMTGKEFGENYSEELREHLEAEADRIADIPNYDPKLLTSAEDALEAIDDYIEKDDPFEHPVHWASLGCYGLR